ncbi:NirD/YgiW/YdeI family stress tolerance protein [Variovorax sp. J22R24]|uniref:YgiW/YdeI family stress tolerance OB fold protein n=1 Tax=Variovorax gracilis TaxID=3053502 RepID=UPI002577829D|nr:NirD/YgiW/YdeI family stress tolerance protein [Variovorax sp. J22R24]MDM0106192.1 NirD/YgiW/YdeI family stress tolerance protein [Variovorax sp. J22R24]
MKQAMIKGGLIAALLTSGNAAVAQYVGPSGSPVTTARQLVDSARDKQYVRLQGRIVSHDGGEKYTFADESGRLSVEISAHRFPAGQPIGADRQVEILVEVDKDLTKTEFEVEQIRLLP